MATSRNLTINKATDAFFQIAYCQRINFIFIINNHTNVCVIVYTIQLSSVLSLSD
nr:hypothetical protein [Mucilaginibacter sp. X5P1]